MAHSVIGFFIYFGFFAALFALIWVIQYFIWKHNIKRMNERMKD
jgi:F0F1-type ATP synthase membrane subunit b/b'